MTEVDRMKEARLWADYERGKVGFQLEGMPRRLVSPTRAREIADELEAELQDGTVDSRDVDMLKDFIGDLREKAGEVEPAYE